MHTYTNLYLAHPLETWTPFDIVVNSAYALLTMTVTYKPTNVVISPFIRYSGTSAYNIYILVDTFGGQFAKTFCCVEVFDKFCCVEVFEPTVTFRIPAACRCPTSRSFPPRANATFPVTFVVPWSSPLVKEHFHGAFLQFEATTPYHADLQDLNIQ